MPGPMRKRDAERRRRNKDDTPTIKVDLDETLAGEIEIPAPPTYFDEHKDDCPEDCEKHSGEWESSWHPFAEQAYLSLTKSGQVIFFEASDWATAFVLCEMISRELKPKPMTTTDADGASTIHWVKAPVNGSVMNAFLSGWASLMTTEGSRRKLRIELDRKKRQEEILGGSTVVSITQNREALFS